MHDALPEYSIDVERHQILGPEEEAVYARQMANGDIDARNRIVTSNLRLVLKIATEYGNLAPRADLVGAGNMGLIVAANRFNPDLGYKFITYAVWWIRSSMRSVCLQGTVHVPEHRRKERIQLNRLIERDGAMGDFASEGFHQTKVRDLLTYAGDTTSLDAPMPDGERSLSDHISADLPSPASQIEHLDEQDRLHRCINKLRPMQAYVVRCYYGLGEQAAPMTMEKLARHIGRSKARVGQILEASLLKLRGYLQRDLDDAL